MDKDCTGKCPFCKCLTAEELELQNRIWWEERLGGDMERENN